MFIFIYSPWPCSCLIWMEYRGINLHPSSNHLNINTPLGMYIDELCFYSQVLRHMSSPEGTFRTHHPPSRHPHHYLLGGVLHARHPPAPHPTPRAAHQDFLRWVRWCECGHGPSVRGVRRQQHAGDRLYPLLVHRPLPVSCHYDVCDVWKDSLQVMAAWPHRRDDW